MPPPSPEAADFAACRALLRGGSRSFHAASFLLPRALRDPAAALYAFCRQADDAVDVEGGRAEALAALADRLARAYEGRPLALAVDRAFADAVARFAIPRALPEALIEGLAWDAEGRRYATLGDLHAYAARVAGAVGAMMATLMGARDPAAIARACDLGVAMQLTNIARDVGEDARAGRIYLPLDWLRDAGIDAGAWLAAPAFSPALGGVIARLLGEADALYDRAIDGVGRLPRACRPGVHAARILYAEIGREVERGGLDSVSRRAVVPLARKLWLLPRSVAAAALPRIATAAPPLDAVRFIVDAVAAAPVPFHAAVAAGDVVAWWDLDERASRLVALFERLERREREAGARAAAAVREPTA